MAKKTTAKAPTQSKAKTKKAPAKAKAAQAKPAVKQKTGMWKILEQKQAQQKLQEQARLDGQHPHQNPGHEFHSTPRDPRFTKFAGPRRKAG